ncbi:unnamed protein product [Schistocephalus solidus]|uniref:Uncharacterized protein n=1 Tax=Schistocephalus solidus TaxID=70667 RepID=A0A183SUR0_SCHSO|nr:unnamed protein product [Schistocephalus solidus]
MQQQPEAPLIATTTPIPLSSPMPQTPTTTIFLPPPSDHILDVAPPLTTVTPSTPATAAKTMVNLVTTTITSCPTTSLMPTTYETTPNAPSPASLTITGPTTSNGGWILTCPHRKSIAQRNLNQFKENRHILTAPALAANLPTHIQLPMSFKRDGKLSVNKFTHHAATALSECWFSKNAFTFSNGPDNSLITLEEATSSLTSSSSSLDENSFASS